MFIGGINLPCPVMAGKNGIVLPSPFLLPPQETPCRLALAVLHRKLSEFWKRWSDVQGCPTSSHLTPRSALVPWSEEIGHGSDVPNTAKNMTYGLWHIVFNEQKKSMKIELPTFFAYWPFNWCRWTMTRRSERRWMGTSSIYPESPAERDTGISNCRILFPTSRGNFVFQETLKKDSSFYWEIIGVFHKPISYFYETPKENPWVSYNYSW